MLKEIILIILLLFIGIILYFHATTRSTKEGLVVKGNCKLTGTGFGTMPGKYTCQREKDRYLSTQRNAKIKLEDANRSKMDRSSPYYMFQSNPNYAKLVVYTLTPWDLFLNGLSADDDIETAIDSASAFMDNLFSVTTPSPSTPVPSTSSGTGGGSTTSPISWSIGQTPQCINIYNQNPKIDSTNITQFQQCYVAPVQQSIAVVGNYLNNIDPDSTSNANLLNVFTQDVQNANAAIAEISNNTWKNAAISMNTNYNVLQSDISNLIILSNISPYSFINLSTGGTVPTGIKTNVANNTCSPLVDPSYNNQQLSILNQTLQQNKNILADLEKQIENIKSRYPIQFSVGSVLTNNKEKAQPELSIDGELPNPVLNFLLLVPVDGQHGIEGKRGSIGPNGNPGETGSIGLQGYWGPNGIAQR